MKADDIIRHLRLDPHPEGGWYRQTWAADTPGDSPGRPLATCIYFLLTGDQVSHWHKVDATEIWLYHSGAPLIVSLSPSARGPARDHRLAPDLSPDPAQGAPQLIVPQDHWQSARSTGDWTLVSCIVAPGFQFSGFTLAPPEFDIPR